MGSPAGENLKQIIILLSLSIRRKKYILKILGYSKQYGSYVLMISGRFFVGINSGLSAGLASMYLSEISPISLRGGVSSRTDFYVKPPA